MKLLVLSVFLISLNLANCYLPGLNQHRFKQGDVVPVKTRKLFSRKNLPYDFYSLSFCRPNPVEVCANSLGEVLFGDRIENSLFQINMLEEVKCKLVENYVDTKCKPNDESCKKTKADCPKLKKADFENFKKTIMDEYDAQLIVDSLPVANLQRPTHCGEPPSKIERDGKYTRADGFPIGCTTIDKKRVFLNNHYHFVIQYYEHEKSKEYNVVGAAVIPASMALSKGQCVPTSALPTNAQKLEITNADDKTEVNWSYSVEWIKSEHSWASRWDSYLHVGENADVKIHWFSIINSLMIVFFLTGMVAMIMLRVLHKDIALYNMDDEDDPSDETGWKLVHGDVFRKPSGYPLLAVFSGSGAQIFGMVLVTIIFSAIGFLSPTNRGNIITIMLLLFVFMGIFAGFVSLRLYRMFGGDSWKILSVVTALFSPGVVFSIFFNLNLIVLIGSSSTIIAPFTTLLTMLALWFGVSCPLVLLGGYFGYKETIENPTKIHTIPRQIPEQPWYMRPPFSVLMGGILPFGAIFIELYFIMSSIWLHRFYFMFGFLLLVFFILILTCSEITIVMIYFQLCNADYHWWWRSFLTSGSSALYLFLYAIFYFFTKLSAASHFLMGVVFFGYMLIASYAFFVLTGTIGFLSCYWFVRKIYSSIRID